jgi:hypothetical protein
VLLTPILIPNRSINLIDLGPRSMFQWSHSRQQGIAARPRHTTGGVDG